MYHRLVTASRLNVPSYFEFTLFGRNAILQSTYPHTEHMLFWEDVWHHPHDLLPPWLTGQKHPVTALSAVVGHGYLWPGYAPPKRPLRLKAMAEVWDLPSHIVVGDWSYRSKSGEGWAPNFRTRYPELAPWAEPGTGYVSYRLCDADGKFVWDIMTDKFFVSVCCDRPGLCGYRRYDLSEHGGQLLTFLKDVGLEPETIDMVPSGPFCTEDMEAAWDRLRGHKKS